MDGGSSILGVHQHTGQVLTLALFYCDGTVEVLVVAVVVMIMMMMTTWTTTTTMTYDHMMTLMLFLFSQLVVALEAVFVVVFLLAVVIAMGPA